MTSSPDGNDASRVADRASAFAYRGDVTIAIRRLVSGEEAVTDAYLATVPERTLFLRSNLARAGLADDGRPVSGVYAGAFDDGTLAGVAAHFWNDNIVVAPGCAETMSTPDTPEARADQRRYLEAYQDKGHHFVVSDARVTSQHEQGGGLGAYSAFNATIADTVQIGGVWTPPPQRGRGHARCVVAGSLQHARDRGVRSAILFTDEKNVAAQRSYVAVGFRPIGDYGIVFFAED
jgi:RimJ/RimL family protein N-acetyltransferase